MRLAFTSTPTTTATATTITIGRFQTCASLPNNHSHYLLMKETNKQFRVMRPYLSLSLSLSPPPPFVFLLCVCIAHLLLSFHFQCVFQLILMNLPTQLHI
jgi:hypothetical protein